VLNITVCADRVQYIEENLTSYDAR